MKGPEQTYRDLLEAGEFKLQRCHDCRTNVFFPRIACPRCGSLNLSWVNASGLGTVYSTTVVRRRPEAGGDLNVALIELDEGVRMMSRVEDIPPDEVRIGMRVRSTIVESPTGALVVFTVMEPQA